METRLTIFLAFVFIALLTNTLLIWFVYKTFLGVTSKLAETATEFQRSGMTREWLNALEAASQHAAEVTGSTKERMAELDPVLDQTRQKYADTLARANAKLEHAAEEVTKGAEKMREVVSKPAVSIVSFMAGVSSYFSSEPEE